MHLERGSLLLFALILAAHDGVAGFKVPKTRSQKARAFAQLANLERTADGVSAKQQLQQQRKRLRSSHDASNILILPSDARNKLKKIGLRNGGSETRKSTGSKPPEPAESECASSVPGVMSFVADTADSSANKAEGMAARPVTNSGMAGGRIATLRDRKRNEEGEIPSVTAEVEGGDSGDDDDDVIEVKTVEDEEMAAVVVEEVQATSAIDEEQGEEDVSAPAVIGGNSGHAATDKRKGRKKSKEVSCGGRDGEVATRAGATEQESARVVRSSPRLPSLQPIMAGVDDAAKGRGEGRREGENLLEDQGRGTRRGSKAADGCRRMEESEGDAVEGGARERQQELQIGSAGDEGCGSRERESRERDNSGRVVPGRRVQSGRQADQRPGGRDRTRKETRDGIAGAGVQAHRFDRTCDAEQAGMKAGSTAGELPGNVRGIDSESGRGDMRELRVEEGATPHGGLLEESHRLRAGEAVSLATNARVGEDSKGGQQQTLWQQQQVEEEGGGALLSGGLFDDLHSVDEISGGFARTYERKGRRTSEGKDGKEGGEEGWEAGKEVRRKSTGEMEAKRKREGKGDRQRGRGLHEPSGDEGHEGRDREDAEEGEGEEGIKRQKPTGGTEAGRGKDTRARRKGRDESDGGDEDSGLPSGPRDRKTSRGKNKVRVCLLLRRLYNALPCFCWHCQLGRATCPSSGLCRVRRLSLFWGA